MSQLDTLTFEKAFSRLEEILEKMNSGALSLDESIRLYEEADQLIQLCNKRLSQAETKIEMLVKNREGNLELSSAGAPVTESFCPSSSALQG
jgi:exodeoxyribonuclease VII small subunit